jgi:histidinol-phosphatase (PHP family)
VLDYHLHLWPHGGPGSQGRWDTTIEQLAAYCEHAGAAGVTELALTEHLFRFRQFEHILERIGENDPDPTLYRATRAYCDFECRADLDRYVEVVLEAKAAGLPVVLGLEVDHVEGHMSEVADILAGHPFDVLLGSVHWIGAWGFDNFDDPAFAAEWERRPVEEVWDAYTRALEELAGSGVVDVLAHPDLCKVTGRVPRVPDEFYDRMAEAAASCGLAAEVSSAGWRKPVAEAYPAPSLLSRFRKAGVPATTASDAHRLDHVADHGDGLRALLAEAGYEHLTAFRARQPRPVEIRPAGAGIP